MSRDEWIESFAKHLGVQPPNAVTVDALLDIAGTAAHATERTAAPLACYLIGLARVDPRDAAPIAQGIV